MGTMEYLTEYLSAAKTALDLFRGIRAELPQGPISEEAGKQIENAAKALKASEAELAKSLGYTLCQCTFPPQIMLSQGRHAKRGDEIFKCSQCGKQEPSEFYFKSLDEDDEAMGLSRGRNPVTGY